MKFLMLLVLLLTLEIVIAAQSSLNGLPFSVDCADETTATLTISKDYILASIDGCSPKLGTSNSSFQNYDLDKYCLTNGTFLVEHIVKEKHLVLAKDSHLFHVECQGNNGTVVFANSSISVGGVTGLPSTETFTSKPLPTPPEVDLFLLKVDPKTTDGGLGAFQKNSLKMAYLGQRIYLSLFADELVVKPTATTSTSAFLSMPCPINPFTTLGRKLTSVEFDVLNLIPLSCEASTDGLEPVTLWKLHNTSNSDECFMEKSVVTSQFVLDKSRVHQFSVAVVEAFRFTENQDGLITFSCQVRVCRKDVGFCLQERKSLESCGEGDGLSTSASPVTTTATNPVRRRRDTQAGSLDGKLHRVSATLRVTRDIFAHDGSAGLHYTVSSLLLVALSLCLT